MRAMLVVGVLIAVGSNCEAGLFMSFTADGSPQALTTINVGQTTTLDVFLLQDAGEFGSPPYSAGLQSGGTRLDFGPEVQATAFTADSAWDLSSLAAMPGSADVSTGIFFNPAVLPAGNAIALGSVTFQGVAPGLATVGFSDPSADLFVLDDGLPTVIDSMIDFASNTAQIQVNGAAVPEPGSIGLSLLLFGVASAVTRFRARRKRNKSGPVQGAGCGL